MANKEHYLDIESRLFENFIYSCFSKTNILEKQDKYYYCPKGLKNICEDYCFLDIKYTNNEEIINNIDYRNLKNEKVVLICLIDESKIEKKRNIVVFGKKSLLGLIKSNLVEWWIFNQSCFIDNDIVIDYDNECYFINSQSLASKELGIKIILDFDKVFELSEINKIDFLESVKRSKKLPGLFVGNGVSIPFGSDSWDVLSNSLFDYLCPLYATNKNLLANKLGKNSIALADIVKQTIDEEKYKDALYNGIYRKYEPKMHTDHTMIRAIAKYKVNHPEFQIITYNYDDFLEKDIELISGIKYKPVYKGNISKVSNSIKHVHGFIESKTVFHSVILSQKDYFDAYRIINELVVPKVQRDLLKEHICLYVGSSMTDLYQLAVIDDVKQELNKSRELWYCYALMCLD